MLGPIFSALSGLKNTSQRLQNSANNVANVNTTVSKKAMLTALTLNQVEPGSTIFPDPILRVH